MSTAVQRRRGTTAQHTTFVGLEGELTVDTTKETVVVHDGVTAGGFPLAREAGLPINPTIVTVSDSVRYADDDASHYVALQAPMTVAANLTFTLPGVDGMMGQAIVTNGAGVLSFASIVSTSSANTYTAKQTFNGSTSQSAASLRNAVEQPNRVAMPATGTIAIDVTTSAIWHYTTNATANHTLNVRGNGTTTLDSLMLAGESLTVVWMVTNGATAFMPTTFQIDGTARTPLWQGGTAPSAGNPNSVDVYTYTIVKTAANTYQVFASQTRFA